MKKPLDEFIVGDAKEVLKEMESEFVDLIVTSPPYNLGKNYGVRDDLPEEEYFEFLLDVFKELFRVAKLGARFALNMPLTGNSWFKRKADRLYFYPSHYFPVIEKSGWIPRDFIIWVKTPVPEDPQTFSGNSTQWGSWLSPSSPFLRCFAEFILIAHKDQKKLDHNGKSDMTKSEFLEWTKNIWYFPSETRFRDLHPAPFPEELPRRLIKLYTFIGDVVLDPFVGIGTTAKAAKDLNRHFIGIDINPKYIETARQRIAQLNLFGGGRN